MKRLVEHIVKGYLLKEQFTRFVYHYTTLDRLYDICTNDEIFLNNKYKDTREEFNFSEMYYFCLTRTFDIRNGFPSFLGVNPIDGVNVRIWFDGDKLNQRFKGKPVDYFYDSPINKRNFFKDNLEQGKKIPKFHSSVETEDRLLSNSPIIKHPKKYMIRIDVLVDPSNDEQMDYLHKLTKTPFWDIMYFHDNQKDFNEKVENIQGFSNVLSSEITKLQKQMENMNKKIFLIHNCANCGATLNIEENKPVFHCKYCGSTYLIGTAQIYSNY
jgi:DNA-directed RNA polymerase subunit RPC12/RpoP